MASIDQFLEKGNNDIFTNDSVKSFSWSNVDVTVKDRTTKKPLNILESCSGVVEAGEMVGLMGPSGSGKTTLLNVLANRSQSSWTGSVCVNGREMGKRELRNISAYVEQDDALIGSLTVRETIEFSARLALKNVPRAMRKGLVDTLVSAFGLTQQQNTIIGTPLQKGISGGQKRRVSVASQLVTSPQILFLDEPTSGLDSAASFEVMKFISTIAKRHQLIVIVSIHQPATTTFQLFDKLMLLSTGKTCYFGSIESVRDHFVDIAPIPTQMNPAEFLLDLVNIDFLDTQGRQGDTQLASILSHWTKSPAHADLLAKLVTPNHPSRLTLPATATKHSNFLTTTFTLLHRNFIKSYRDVLAYGTRIAMYLCLSILMGTVWLRLPATQSSIQPLINSLFFGGAFLSFMAVAYVPSIIEDISTLRKEHANGLYGPGSFMIANFLIGLPWLALIVVLFTVVCYWLTGFWATAQGFWTVVGWLWMDLLAAEGLVVLVSAVAPIFVVALAAAAFANGLWMCVGGFLVPMSQLNVFWKYVFHYIDYQAYVFQAMMFNQFKHTTYRCDKLGSSAEYYCIYPSDLASEGKIRGTTVLDVYGYSTDQGKMWEWAGIMIAIIIMYRILGMGALWLRCRGGR